MNGYSWKDASGAGAEAFISGLTGAQASFVMDAELGLGVRLEWPNSAVLVMILAPMLGDALDAMGVEGGGATH